LDVVKFRYLSQKQKSKRLLVLKIKCHKNKTINK